MSLILDALNKSDREARNLSARPDLTPNRAPAERLARTRNLLLALIALLILMAVALLAVIVVRHSAEPAPPAQSQEPSMPTTPAPTLQAAAPDAPEPKPAATPASDPEVSALYQAEVSAEVLELPAPEIVTPASSVSAEDEALARYLWERSAPQPLTQTVTPSEPPAAAVEPAPSEAPASVALEDSVRGLSDVAFLHKLPLTVQNRIPTLMYAAHNYGEGFVVINKQTLNVGDAAAEGVVIEQIMADGAVFSFGNERFKLQAQSSWVNY